MILIAAIIAGVGVALAVVIVQLSKAPVAYEDADGFHVVEQLKTSAVLRHPKSKGAAASLESIEAHS